MRKLTILKFAATISRRILLGKSCTVRLKRKTETFSLIRLRFYIERV